MKEAIRKANELADGLWTIPTSFRVAGVDFAGRMTVCRLTDGDLWIHSPVKADATVFQELDTLGKVRAIVAPNNFHHMFISSYKTAYPDAQIFAIDLLAKKRDDLISPIFLERKNASPWPELECLVVAPRSFFHEAVFLHKATKTLILTDLAFNFQGSYNWWTTMNLKIYGAYRKFGPSRFARFLLGSSTMVREDLQKILTWDFERIIVTHGDLIHDDAKAKFRSAFAKFLS